MGLKKEIEKYLKEHISSTRYTHVLGVRKAALELGELYYNKSLSLSKKDFLKKLELAALLHDIDKGENVNKQWENIQNSNLFTEEEKNAIKNDKVIYHAYTAAIIAKEKFLIEDTDILNSVMYHTTGRENMTIFDKIIYLADFIEEGRDFDKVEYFRKLALKNLDKAVFEAMNHTIDYLKDNSKDVNMLTIKARDYLGKELNR